MTRPKTLNYSLAQSFHEELQTISNLAVLVIFEAADNVPLESTFLKTHLDGVSLFKISPGEEIESVQFKAYDFSRVSSLIKFKRSFTKDSIELEFSPDPTKFTDAFNIVEESKKIKV